MTPISAPATTASLSTERWQRFFAVDFIDAIG
jgi:hypothetical protein